MAGEVSQVKSVVRQVYTLRLHPQVQRIFSSTPTTTGWFSYSVTRPRSLPARVGSISSPTRESCGSAARWLDGWFWWRPDGGTTELPNRRTADTAGSAPPPRRPHACRREYLRRHRGH